MPAREISIGDILLKDGSKRTFRTVERIVGQQAYLRKPNQTPCRENIWTLMHDYSVVAKSAPSAPAIPADPIPIGTVIMKGACVVDAKGNDVYCNDIVVDSFGTTHTVLAIEPIDTDHAWIVDSHKVRLIPHLTEKVG